MCVWRCRAAKSASDVAVTGSIGPCWFRHRTILEPLGRNKATTKELVSAGFEQSWAGRSQLQWQLTGNNSDGRASGSSPVSHGTFGRPPLAPPLPPRPPPRPPLDILASIREALVTAQWCDATCCCEISVFFSRWCWNSQKTPKKSYRPAATNVVGAEVLRCDAPCPVLPGGSCPSAPNAS